MTEPGFSPHTEHLLARAGAMCAARGAKLTALRRDILGLILDAETPAGAYDLLNRLRRTRAGAAPPTVYRTLDFLCAQGLVHRVERLAAFVGCVAHGEQDPDPGAPAPDHADPHHADPHHTGAHHAGPDRAGPNRAAPAPHAHTHAAQFLICRGCGRAIELDDPDLAHALAAAAARRGFAVSAATIEAEGLCAACTAAARVKETTPCP